MNKVLEANENHFLEEEYSTGLTRLVGNPRSVLQDPETLNFCSSVWYK